MLFANCLLEVPGQNFSAVSLDFQDERQAQQAKMILEDATSNGYRMGPPR